MVIQILIKRVRPSPYLTASSESKVFHAGTKLVGGNILSNGGRVLCATSLGMSLEEAQEKAYNLVNMVNWDGSYYRTDIGFKGL